MLQRRLYSKLKTVIVNFIYPGFNFFFATSVNTPIKIAKKCPEDGDDDSCDLTADEGALYEGPNAIILTDIEATECQQRCL